MEAVGQVEASAPLKYYCLDHCFTYSARRSWAEKPSFKTYGLFRSRSRPMTLSGGEFNWGGTSVTMMKSLNIVRKESPDLFFLETLVLM